MSTIKDVADAVGVSTATVSRALRGLPRVSEETRGQVLRAAAALGYVASPSASSLASGRTNAVGVIVPFVTRWFFANVVQGAEEVLRAHGYDVLLYNVGASEDARRLVYGRRLLHKRVDAVMVLSLALEQHEIDALRELNLPIATVGSPVANWDVVQIDDVQAAMTATRHLLELGHTRIAHIGSVPAGPSHFHTPANRQKGYRAALAEAGVDCDPDLDVPGDYTVGGGEAAMVSLLSLPSRPTAVFAASDEMAMGAIHAVRKAGLRVPEDISVIGIDDHEMSFLMDLTTVAQPVHEQGRIAADLLLKAMATGTQAPREVQVITAPTSLVVRRTTAAPADLATDGHRPSPP